MRIASTKRSGIRGLDGFLTQSLFGKGSGFNPENQLPAGKENDPERRTACGESGPGVAGGGGDAAGIYQRLILRECPQAAMTAWGQQ